MTPKLRHLQACHEIRQLGTISAAARRVNLSQPALTEALGNIEQYFGAALFERGRTGTSLTAAGEICAPRIERTLVQIREALCEFLRRSAVPTHNSEKTVLRMTSAQLAALVALAEHESFARAARAKGLTQPALHRAASTLQKMLAVPLFEKTSFGVRPTRDAKAFARRVRLAFGEIEQARADITSLQGGPGGKTVIGAMPLARSFIVPSAVIAFARNHPAHSVAILDGTYENLLAALESGDADVLIGALSDSRVTAQVRQEHLFDDVLSIAMRAAHPLAGRKRLGSEDLRKYPWIAPRASSPLRAHFRHLFTSAGLPEPAQSVQCNSLTAARAFLLESDCLMLASTQQIYYELRAGLLAAVPHPQGNVVRSIGLTVRRHWQPTRAQAELLDLLRHRARATACEHRD
ncbi:MAG: LysR family transcriptional regulator [Pseudomonadota bacterium]